MTRTARSYTGLMVLGLVAVVVATVVLPFAAEAQERRFEIAPFVGWRQGGELVDDPTGLAIDLESGTAFGFTADIAVTPTLQVEFLWSHTKSDFNIGLDFGDIVPPVEFPLSAVYVDYFQGGLLYQWNLSNPDLKPYVVGTLGATVFTPELENLDTVTSFSWGVGGGVKYFFGRNFGVRAEYRLLSTRTDFVGTDVWCTPFGFCYRLTTKQNLWQSQVAAALVVAF